MTTNMQETGAPASTATSGNKGKSIGAAIATAIRVPEQTMKNALRDSALGRMLFEQAIQEYSKDIVNLEEVNRIVGCIESVVDAAKKQAKKAERKGNRMKCIKHGCDCEREPTWLKLANKVDVKCQTRNCGNWVTMTIGGNAWCKKCKQPIERKDYAAWANKHGSMRRDENDELTVPVLTLPQVDELFDAGDDDTKEVAMDYLMEDDEDDELEAEAAAMGPQPLADDDDGDEVAE